MGTGTEIHLYYTRHKYTLTLNTGENIETVTGTGLYKIGQVVEINAKLNKNPEGHQITWNKWESSNKELLENQTNQKTSITIPKGNVTLTAIASKTPNKYTITFDPNGGTVAKKNKEITYNQTYGDLPTPIRTGYTFTGWYTKQTQQTEETQQEIETLITRNTKVTTTKQHTLYAHWTPNNYILTIKHYLENPNDDNYTQAKTTKQTIPYDTTINLEEHKTNIQNGTYHHASTIEGTATQTTMGINTQISLYYKRNKKTLILTAGENIESVTLGENTQTTIEKQYKIGQTIEITAKLNKNPEGHEITWDKWQSNNQSLLQNTNKQTTTIQMPEGDITLTAQGTKTPNTYQVQFNANGGTVEPTTKQTTYNQEYGQLPTPEKEGHTFTGWYTEAEENEGTKIEETTKVTTGKNHTLYAHYQPATYILTIKHYLENANDNNYTLNKTTIANKTYGTTINLENYKTNITNEAEETIGTYKQGKLQENGEKTETTTMGTQTTIYLYYTRNKYTLTLSIGENIETVEGEGTYKVGQTVEIGAKLKPKTGYAINWSGWTTNDIITTDTIMQNIGKQNLEITMPAKDIILTANGKETPNVYTINLDNQSPTTTGDTIIYEKYDIGIYKESNCITKIILEDNPIIVPSRIGYTFGGYYTQVNGEGQQLINEKGNITNNFIPSLYSEDSTIYAKWIPNKYIIDYDINGGDTISQTSKEVVYDSAYGEMPIPQKEGFSFTGWYTENGNLVNQNDIVKILENKILYAHWTIKKYTLTVEHYLEDANNSYYLLNTTNTISNIDYGTKITLDDYKTTIANSTYIKGSLVKNGSISTSTTINNDTTIYLYYNRNRFSLTVTAGSNITSVTGTGTYKVGQSVPITATRAVVSGYDIRWSGWTSSNPSLLSAPTAQNTSIIMPAGNVTLTASATKTIITYSVTYNVNSMTYSTSPTSLNSGASFSTILTPNNPLLYERPRTVTITMGGTTLTSGYTYNYVDGSINISNITGNVVISASAVYCNENISFANAYTVSEGATISANVNQSYRIRTYKFVPTVTGTYRFYSTDPVSDTKATDPYAYLFDGTSNSASSLDVHALNYARTGDKTGLDNTCLVKDDDSANGFNFSMVYNCQAGRTYYLVIRTYSTSAVQSFTNIHIQRQ